MSSSPTAASASAHSDKISSPMSSSPPKEISPVPTPKTTQNSSTQNPLTRPLSDIIGETFPPFEHQANIVSPFNDEMVRDSTFERGTKMIPLPLTYAYMRVLKHELDAIATSTDHTCFWNN